jgi:hypothetical protein
MVPSYKMSHSLPKIDKDLETNLNQVFGKYGWQQKPYYKEGEKPMTEEVNNEIVVDADIVEEQHKADAIEVSQQNNQLNTNIFGTTNPADFVAKSQEYAKALVDVVENQNLFALIQGKKYVTFEGWQFLGSMLPTAITPQTEWTTELRDETTGQILGYKTRVVAKDVNGNERGAAESVCMFAEKNWAGKDANALMSMAQTRASSKALRMALSSIVKLAGYEPTPKEEMDGVTVENNFNSNKPQFSNTIPNPPAQAPVQNNGGTRMATEKQVNFVRSLINRNKEHSIWQDKERLNDINNGNITFDDAKLLIDQLK